MDGKDTGLMLLLLACDDKLTYLEKEFIKKKVKKSYTAVMLAPDSPQYSRMMEIRSEVVDACRDDVINIKRDLRRKSQAKSKKGK